MSRIRPIAALAGLLPLLAGCSSASDVVLTPQSTALLVAPSSMVLSMSSPSAVTFGIADSASNAGTITVNQDSCSGIATDGLPASSKTSKATLKTVGSNPGINGSPGSGSTFSVSPIALGRCTIRVSDSAGNVATVYVVVNN
jgi:hypothetical protein